ncbi:MAG: DsbA family protein [Rickettsiales bacterium]|jgi:protein-disulfide isomerase|nr:DsbA family protein [Rickettsiales bacterium]
MNTALYSLLLLIAFAILLAYKYFYTQVLPKKAAPKKAYMKIVREVVVPASVAVIAMFFTSMFATRITMTADYTVLRDSVENLQAGMERDKNSANEAAIEELRSDADALKYAPIFGNPDAKIVVFEFMDYYCGHCRTTSPIIEAALKARTDVKVVLKPLTFMSPVSSIPAKAVIAAQMQGKAAELNAAMMAGNIMPDTTKVKSIEEAEDAVKSMIIAMAKKIGLDTKKLSDDMNSKEVEEEILRTRDHAQLLQINSTPNFVVGNTIHPGAFQSVEQFNAAVDNAN